MWGIIQLETESETWACFEASWWSKLKQAGEASRSLVRGLLQNGIETYGKPKTSCFLIQSRTNAFVILVILSPLIFTNRSVQIADPLRDSVLWTMRLGQTQWNSKHNRNSEIRYRSVRDKSIRNNTNSILNQFLYLSQWDLKQADTKLSACFTGLLQLASPACFKASRSFGLWWHNVTKY